MNGTLRTQGRALLCALVLALPVAGCAGGNGLLPAENDQAAMRFASYDEVVDAFEQIVPGTTRAEDLAHIGFDPLTANVEVLSYLGIEERFMPNDSFRFDRLDPAVQACILAENGCTGYVFRPEHSVTKRIGNTTLDLLGFERVTRSEHWSAEIVLLVQNGIVVHKVFSGHPRAEKVDDKVQPLGPLQDVGNAMLRGAQLGTGY